MRYCLDRDEKQTKMDIGIRLRFIKVPSQFFYKCWKSFVHFLNNIFSRSATRTELKSHYDMSITNINYIHY